MSAPRVSPFELSAYLNRTAADIRGTRNKSRVQRRLAKAVTFLDGSASSLDSLHLALEEVDISLWDLEQGEALESAYKEARRQTVPDKLQTALKMVRRRVDDFVKELSREGGEKRPVDDDSDVVTSVK